MSNTVELSTSPVFAEVRDDEKASNQTKDSPLGQGASYITPAGQDVAYPLPDYEVYPMPPGNNQVYPPGYGYPLQYGMPNGSQQVYYAQGPQPYSMGPYMASQQQQATNVVISGQRNIEPNQPKINFTGPIVLACFTAWCCNCLFGLIAFILASKIILIIKLNSRF